jgi:peptidoglycan/LPS O-acetylase OafA/YrhL
LVTSVKAVPSTSDAGVIPADRSKPAWEYRLDRPVNGAGGASPETGARDRVKAAAVAGRNIPIQCLRGLAALFVVVYHASTWAEMILGGASWAAVFDGRLGLVGVAVFFAISGLLMADLIQRTDPWRFLGHRIVRIYPAFLLAVAIAAPLTALAGGYRPSFHGLSLLLAPAGWRPYYLGVEWTLVFECTYYVTLFLIALAGWQRHLAWIVLGWLAAIFAAPLVTGWDDRLLFHFYSLWLAPANVAFAGGLLVPWIDRNLRIPAGAGVLACGILMAAPPDNLMIARWVAGAAATLLVLDAIRIKVPPYAAVTGLLTLGDWSYALYLVHVPTIVVVYHLWPASISAGWAWPSAVAIALTLSAGFGMADVRMYRYFRKGVDELSEKERRRRVNLYVGVFIAASLAAVVV